MRARLERDAAEFGYLVRPDSSILEELRFGWVGTLGSFQPKDVGGPHDRDIQAALDASEGAALEVSVAQRTYRSAPGRGSTAALVKIVSDRGCRVYFVQDGEVVRTGLCM